MPYEAPFPMAFDSTMLGAFRSCPHKYYREYFQHWKRIEESPDLVAGKAFAAGVDAARKAYYNDKIEDTDACIGVGVQALIREWGSYEPPADHVKSLDRMIGALDEYFQHYGFITDHIQPLMQDGKAAVEFSFALPIPGTTHPTTGDPILYTGRFDMLGLYNNAIFGIDEKTTKQLGASWYKNWTLRSQFTGYCWAAKEYGYPVAGFIVRGISILKTKYGHAESIQYRPDWFIDQWLEQVRRDINRMITCWEEGYWDFNLDTACTHYGGCVFTEVCTNPKPDEVLVRDFQKRIWDPMEREETVVTDPPPAA